MPTKSFELVFADWKKRAEALDRLLRPITHAEVDINDPELDQKLKSAPHPADVTRQRDQIRLFFNEVITRFATLDADQRQMVIDLMDRCDALMWSRVIDADPRTPEGFRKHLIAFVIEDQGKDTRDAIMNLGSIRDLARNLHFDAKPIFKEAASLASTRNKFGMGSTRDLFKHY